jgi:hypothetical protein
MPPSKAFEPPDIFVQIWHIHTQTICKFLNSTLKVPNTPVYLRLKLIPGDQFSDPDAQTTAVVNDERLPV